GRGCRAQGAKGRDSGTRQAPTTSLKGSDSIAHGNAMGTRSRARSKRRTRPTRLRVRPLRHLLAPLDLGWRARTEKELFLTTDLIPLLKRQAGTRDNSGLKAHEEQTKPEAARSGRAQERSGRAQALRCSGKTGVT